jgi:hypothetical protein
MIRKTLSGSLIALALMGSAYAGGGSSFAGGFAGGLAAGVVNGLMQQRQQTVVVKEKTVVVHDHSSSTKSTHHQTADASPSPSPKPEKVEATPASTPAPTPIVPVHHEPTLVFTEPVKIDEPTDLNAVQRALLTDKEAVKAYFEYFFQHTKPNFTLSDSSLFMEVQVGAYHYMVAKIAMNTPSGATLEQGFVIDLKNQFCTTLDLDTYHQFMHTGNISLLGERELNPLE